MFRLKNFFAAMSFYGCFFFYKPIVHFFRSSLFSMSKMRRFIIRTFFLIILTAVALVRRRIVRILFVAHLQTVPLVLTVPAVVVEEEEVSVELDRVEIMFEILIMLLVRPLYGRVIFIKTAKVLIQPITTTAAAAAELIKQPLNIILNEI